MVIVKHPFIYKKKQYTLLVFKNAWRINWTYHECDDNIDKYVYGPEMKRIINLYFGSKIQIPFQDFLDKVLSDND